MGWMIAVLWIIAVLTGGCTVFLYHKFSGEVFVADIGLILAIGGLPFLIGLGMIKLGSVIRGKKEED